MLFLLSVSSYLDLLYFLFIPLFKIGISTRKQMSVSQTASAKLHRTREIAHDVPFLPGDISPYVPLSTARCDSGDLQFHRAKQQLHCMPEHQILHLHHWNGAKR